MTKKNKYITLLMLFWAAFGLAQMDRYNFKRELLNTVDGWNKLSLPDELFSIIQSNCSDIRIYGITSLQDTIEAPYLLRLNAPKSLERVENFKIVNQSFNDRGYFYTLALDSKTTINQLTLDFEKTNFDWKVSVEGSHNQKEWFTLVEDARVLSLSNEDENYAYTKINFPSSGYRYLRVCIKTTENPQLSHAQISFLEESQGQYRNYPLVAFQTTEEEKTNETVIEAKLRIPVPVSQVKINVKDRFDYYRPITIEYAADSIKTAKGWRNIYQTLTYGTLSSVEDNNFDFNTTVLNNLKISISNRDNESLTIDDISLTGYQHELLVRITEPATYFLTYGNIDASFPSYDINRFAPLETKTIPSLGLGKEQKIDQINQDATEPLFINKKWLWLLLILIGIVLGGFSIQMLRSKSDF